MRSAGQGRPAPVAAVSDNAGAWARSRESPEVGRRASTRFAMQLGPAVKMRRYIIVCEGFECNWLE